MNISIITVCYNSAETLAQCIESVLSQDYPEVEYIVIDGASSDHTSEILQQYSDRISTIVSEPDEGIYDAMNKGIDLATGEIVGILNADDFYADHQVLTKVISKMQADQTDACFADLIYVDEHDLEKVLRYYPGKGFQPSMMRTGNMPPHPTFFVKKRYYEQLGGFDKSFRIAADFEWMVRYFHVAKGSYSYLPEVIVHMRLGGSSTSGLSSTFTINREMLRGCKKHGIRTNLVLIYSKYLRKIFQLWKRPALSQERIEA